MTQFMRDQEKYDEGYNDGEKLFAALAQMLVKNNRISDLEKASYDKGTEKGKIYARKQVGDFNQEGNIRKREKKKRIPSGQAGITATILFIFTTIAVTYACNRMADKPIASALRKP